MSFDEQPDGDPHGECAAEIYRLEQQRDELQLERDSYKSVAEAHSGAFQECIRLREQRDELLAALKEVTPWLEGAVKCKEFRWDFDQQQCAEGAIWLANAAIAKVQK